MWSEAAQVFLLQAEVYKMSQRQVAASIVIGLAVLVLIIRLVQKQRLDIAYAWLWLGVGVGMILVVVRYGWLVWFATLIGAKVVTTALFLLGMLVVLLMCLQFSIVISTQRRQIKKLAQQVAMLTAEARPEAGGRRPEEAKQERPEVAL